MPNQHWQQAITWTNIDLSSKVLCGIHLTCIPASHELNSYHVHGDYTFKITTTYPRALSYNSDLMLSQSFQPMVAQLSKKAALPLAKILATTSCRSSKTGLRGQRVAWWSILMSTANVLTNFYAVASSLRPPVPSGYSFDHYGYRICGQFDGTPLASNPATIVCDNDDAIGRYAFVYINGKNALYLCEVEIFGERKSTDISKPTIGIPLQQSFEPPNVSGLK